MQRPLGKFTKENHLSLLLKNMPLFVMVYLAECYMAYNFFHTIIDPDNFSTSLALCLIAMLTCFYIYNKYHHILMFSDKLQIYFAPLNRVKTIHFSDIKDIQTVDENHPFGTMSIILTDESVIDLHFIDHPKQIRVLLQTYINKNKEAQAEDQAA